MNIQIRKFYDAMPKEPASNVKTMLICSIEKCRSEKVINLYNLYSSKDKEAQNLALKLGNSRYHPHMYICEKTYKLLKLCTPYYQYIGIRTKLPTSTSTWGVTCSILCKPFVDEWDYIFDNTSDINGELMGMIDKWPAIWRLLEHVEITHSCANGQQAQIDQQCTTGLYQNINGKWYKHVYI